MILPIGGMVMRIELCSINPSSSVEVNRDLPSGAATCARVLLLSSAHFGLTGREPYAVVPHVRFERAGRAEMPALTPILDLVTYGRGVYTARACARETLNRYDARGYNCVAPCGADGTRLPGHRDQAGTACVSGVPGNGTATGTSSSGVRVQREGRRLAAQAACHEFERCSVRV